MKKLIFLLLVTAAMFSVIGCSEKFNVAAPYKNITVVYALLDASDTAHYVRIQKAFLDQDKSSLTMAKTADSSFYTSINVMIKRYTVDGLNILHDTIHLNRVDLNAEGYPKQPGVFFDAPNYAYKFTNSLDARYSYRIFITNFATGEVDSSDAPVIEDRDPSKFSVPLVDDTATNHQGMSFFSVLPHRYVEISGAYLTPSAYSFYGQTSPVGVAQAVVRFNWNDSDISTHQKSSHYYDYDAGFFATIKGQFDYKIDNIELYSAIAAGMTPTASTVIRLIDRCDLFVYVATPDYYQYQQVGLTQGTGLTGSEIEPMYTNVKGLNALGLYTSRGYKSTKITITDRTIDSLIISPLLTHTNLKGKAY